MPEPELEPKPESEPKQKLEGEAEPVIATVRARKKFCYARCWICYLADDGVFSVVSVAGKADIFSQKFDVLGLVLRNSIAHLS